MADETPGNVVVLLFGSAAPGHCSLNRCPMSVHGPFRTRAEAHAYAERMPETFEPHIMTVDKPMEVGHG